MSTTPSSFTAVSLDRRIQMLRTAMGPLIAAALEDPDVVEIMLNPDRTLWVDRLSTGRAPMGVELSEADGERIIRLVAAHVGAEVHRGQPLLTAELPETGERFEGILPPAAPGPAFALRKRAFGVIPLSRYIEDGMMTAAQAGLLVRAVRERKNILIAGGTSTGKTTLANALLSGFLVVGLGMLHGALNSVVIFAAMHAGAETTYLQWLIWCAWVIPLNMLGGLAIITLPRLVRTWELVAAEREAQRRKRSGGQSADGTGGAEPTPER